jgi:hypothetical protein
MPANSAVVHPIEHAPILAQLALAVI